MNTFFCSRRIVLRTCSPVVNDSVLAASFLCGKTNHRSPATNTMQLVDLTLGVRPLHDSCTFSSFLDCFRPDRLYLCFWRFGPRQNLSYVREPSKQRMARSWSGQFKEAIASANLSGWSPGQALQKDPDFRQSKCAFSGDTPPGAMSLLK